MGTRPGPSSHPHITREAATLPSWPSFRLFLSLAREGHSPPDFDNPRPASRYSSPGLLAFPDTNDGKLRSLENAELNAQDVKRIDELGP